MEFIVEILDLDNFWANAMRMAACLAFSNALIALYVNILNPNFPKLPWDWYIDRNGFRLYVPIVSGFVGAIILYYTVGQLINGFSAFSK